MSNESTPAKKRQGLSELALATGLGSIACAALHLVTEIGMPLAIIGIVLGLAGLVFGIIALKKHQHRGMAVTGLITGVLGALFFIGLLFFAMLFLGVAFAP